MKINVERLREVLDTMIKCNMSRYDCNNCKYGRKSCGWTPDPNVELSDVSFDVTCEYIKEP